MISKKNVGLFVAKIIHIAKVLDLQRNTPNVIGYTTAVLEALGKERRRGVLHDLDRFWLEARVKNDVGRDHTRHALERRL